MIKYIRKHISAIAFILAILTVSIFRGIPLITVVIKSFFTNTLGSANSFIGINNYIDAINDSLVWQTFFNSLILLLYIPILLILSLIIGTIIYDGIKFSNIYKTIIVIPQVVSTLIVASIFGSIFGYNGVINSLAEIIKIEPIYWLGAKTSAFFVVSLCMIYTMFGWQVLIFSGAFSSMDPNIRSLTLLDGVGFWRKVIIYSVSIKKAISFSLVLNIIYGFSGFFPVIFTLTKGGPGYSTTTIDYLIYLRAFGYGSELSSAYTVSALLLVIVIIFVMLFFTITEKVGDRRANNEK